MTVPRLERREPIDHTPDDGTRAVADGRQVAADLAAFSQPMIPHLRGIVNGASDRAAADGQPLFAHPFERTFAEILSFYGEPWSYEPTPFILAEGPDGITTELFMPDFYLPRQRLYIELTAMRQRLVTRKHRKLRRLAARFPNVRVKLLYRRDYERLETTYHAEENPAPPTGSVLIDEAAIRARVLELAQNIAADQASRGDTRPLLCLAVGRGSEPFAMLLSAALNELGSSNILEGIEASKFSPGAARARVKILRRPLEEVAGRRVLLAADIVSTGLTLDFVSTWLYRRRALSIDVCALMDRSEARIVDVPLRYIGFDVPNELLVGFGLNLYREYRELPHIRALAPGGAGADQI